VDQRAVQFFFSVGSRYSYLASRLVPELEREHGAVFDWIPVHGPDLIKASGMDPFEPANSRGQYTAAYRRADAIAWAKHYAIPYTDPDWDRVDLRFLSSACTAAHVLGCAERFSKFVFEAVFCRSSAPDNPSKLRDCCPDDLPIASLLDVLSGDLVKARMEANLDLARSSGAFGVPTFVTSDGKLFWGQDRVPLLRDHLSFLI